MNVLNPPIDKRLKIGDRVRIVAINEAEPSTCTIPCDIGDVLTIEQLDNKNSIMFCNERTHMNSFCGRSSVQYCIAASKEVEYGKSCVFSCHYQFKKI